AYLPVIAGLAFLVAPCFFTLFSRRSLNSAGRSQCTGFQPASILMGSFVMMLVLTSAGVHYAAPQRIKAGDKRLWQIGALVTLVLGLTAVALQILELLFLPFWPGSLCHAR